MSQTLADLSIKVDISEIQKSQEELKKTADELKKTAAALISFEKETAKVNGALKDVAQSFNPAKLGAAALATAISALTLGAMKEMVTGFIEGAASLNNLSMQTGLTVEELSIMKSVAMQSGTSMDTVTGAVIKFEKSLASSAKETTIQAKAFKELGINTSDTSKTTEEYMSMAASKLEGLKDGWQKNNIVMALFGKSGTEVNEFLSDYANKGDLAAKITAEQAEAAEHYERTMKKLSATSNQYKALIGSALLPVMSSLADELLTMVTTTGKLDAESKKLLTNQIQEWAFLAAKGIAILVDIARVAVNVLISVGMIIGNIAASVVGLGGVLDDLIHGNFTQAANSAKAIGTVFSEGMSEAYHKAMDDGSKYFDFVNKAEENFNKNKDKVTPSTPDKRRQAKNIGDGADTAGDKNKQKDGYAELLLAEDKAIIKLGQDYGELFGMMKQTHAAQMQATVTSDKYKDKLSDIQKTTLLAKAAYQDMLEQIIKVTTAQKASDEAIAKAAQSSKDEIAINQIRLRIKKDLTKTVDDERIAVAKYNVTQAQEALLLAEKAKKEEVVLIKLREELAIRKQLLTTAQTVGDDNKAADDAPKNFVDGWKKARDQYNKDAEDSAKNGAEAYSKVNDMMTSSITSFVETGKFGFADFAASFLKMVEQILVKWAVLNALSLATGGGPVSLSAMFSSKQADGGAWSGGTQMFADGGVVTSPTAFGMSGGKMGLMGEAGPEAIMPLKRGADGKLGVAMSGGGGGGNSVQNNNISISIGSVDSSERAAELQKTIKDTIIATTRQTMSKEMRKGGMLNPVR